MYLYSVKCVASLLHVTCCDVHRLVHDSTFAWKSLRLLARRSPHFFALQSTNTINNNVKMSQMLEDMLNKIAKELPVSDITRALLYCNVKGSLDVAFARMTPRRHLNCLSVT